MEKPSVVAHANKMGELLEGWSELLDNYAPEAGKLREEFLARLRERNIPNVTHANGEIRFGLQKSRLYYFSSHNRGAYLTAAIRAYGKDLYINWTLWWKPKWNVGLILIILAIAVILGFSAASKVPPFMAPAAFFGTMFSTAGILFAIIAVAGIVLRGSPLGFFHTELDYFTIEDMRALTDAVDHSLRQAADAVGIIIKLHERTDPYSGKKSGRRLF